MPDQANPPSPPDWTDHEIDATGMACPQPIIALGRLLRDEPQRPLRIDLTSDDPTTALDLPAWCRLTGNELVESLIRGAATTYRIHVLH